MKILLLGAQGNLGSQLVKTLPADSVTAWTRQDCDLTNLNEMKLKILELQPDIIINTVAYNNVDACETDLNEQRNAIRLNVLLVDCLAEVCQEMDARLIQFSSNYVFNGEKKVCQESDVTDPINFYGLTKQLGEEAVLRRSETGLQALVIRISNLFGPQGTGASSKPSFFEALEKAAEKRESLEIVNDERCCFTYTKDVAKAVAELLEEDKASGIYHLVNSGSATWYEAAQLYFELIEKPMLLKPVAGQDFKRPAKRPASAVLSSTRKAPEMRSFKAALQDYIQQR